MSISIKIDGVVATIHEGEWVTDETGSIPKWRDALVFLTEMDELMRRYGTTDNPDFDMSCATSMAERFNGEVIDTSKHVPPTTDDANVLF
jgi:hypothetical protein